MRFFLPLLILILATTGSAMRLEPIGVRPVRFEGITYSAPPFIFDDKEDQNGGFVEARDPKGKLLWRIQVYVTRYHPTLEQDMQDVFITSLSLDKTHRLLLLSDEKDRVYATDISTHKVTRIK